MSDLIDTTEMYLRTILELEEEGVVPLRARIAERLHQSGPTVSQTVARMERDTLVRVEGDRHLELTDAGRHRAVAVMRKHRLAELLLVNVIGLEYDVAHIEACRWEHVMSAEVERKVYLLLGKPSVSPYGNTIPGLDELDADVPAPQADPATAPAVALMDAPSNTSLLVLRISEQLQNDPQLLRRLQDAGVAPGATISMTHDDDEIVVTGTASSVRLPTGMSNLVFVSQLPQPGESAPSSATPRS
ncbi:MAG: iron dependent repressor, metal binding and dimerization domain protein, partial [Mycobacteriales bacterium]